jgi:hypothetical protein
VFSARLAGRITLSLIFSLFCSILSSFILMIWLNSLSDELPSIDFLEAFDLSKGRGTFAPWPSDVVVFDIIFDLDRSGSSLEL